MFLGPMAGLMIFSYFVVNERGINFDDLLVGNKEDVYWFAYGVIWRVVIAWICGTAPSMPGFMAAIQPSATVSIGLTHLYYICFLAGFAISASIYYIPHFIFLARVEAVCSE